MWLPAGYGVSVYAPGGTCSGTNAARAHDEGTDNAAPGNRVCTHRRPHTQTHTHTQTNRHSLNAHTRHDTMTTYAYYTLRKDRVTHCENDPRDRAAARSMCRCFFPVPQSTACGPGALTTQTPRATTRRYNLWHRPAEHTRKNRANGSAGRLLDPRRRWRRTPAARITKNMMASCGLLEARATVSPLGISLAASQRRPPAPATVS